MGKIARNARGRVPEDVHISTNRNVFNFLLSEFSILRSFRTKDDGPLNCCQKESKED